MGGGGVGGVQLRNLIFRTSEEGGGGGGARWVFLS
jgi:hypothetical protein